MAMWADVEMQAAMAAQLGEEASMWVSPHDFLNHLHQTPSEIRLDFNPRV
jgi:hypothetical protein